MNNDGAYLSVFTAALWTFRGIRHLGEFTLSYILLVFLFFLCFLMFSRRSHEFSAYVHFLARLRSCCGVPPLEVAINATISTTYLRWSFDVKQRYA